MMPVLFSTAMNMDSLFSEPRNVKTIEKNVNDFLKFLAGSGQQNILVLFWVSADGNFHFL